MAVSHPQWIVRIVFGVLCFALAGTVRAPVVSAHLLGQNPQTVADADALLLQSQTQNETDHPLALQTANQAMQIFENLNDEDGIARARMHIAEYQTAQGNLAEAKDYYEAALTFWQQQNNTEQQAKALLSLSMIEQRKGDWASALVYLNGAQPLVNEETLPGQAARIANSFAAIYNDSGFPDLALTEYQRSREYFQRAGEVNQSHRMTLMMGYTYLLQHKYAEAAAHMNEALTNLAPPLYKAQCYEYLGQLHIALNEYPVALQHLQTALATYQAAHNPIETARVLALMGQIQEQQGKLPLARSSYLGALETFQKVQDGVNESAINFSLGKLELKARNYDSAETYFKRSIETTENLRAAAVSRDLSTTYAATVYDRYQAYVDVLIRKHKLQPSRGLEIEAFQTSELARGRSLAELLRDSHRIPENDPNAALAKRERELRQAIGDKMDLRKDLLVDAIKAKAVNKDNPEQLKRELAQLESGLSEANREHAQVAEQLRKQDPFRSQIIQPSAYTLQQIQSEVLEDDQTVLLEYLLADEASYAWVVTRKEAKVYELAKGSQINDAAQKVYDLLSKRPERDGVNHDLDTATKRLSEMVLKPLAEHLNASRLIIVADGKLHFVPFQFLPAPTAPNAEPLIAHYEIVNAPSASILGQLRKQKQLRPPTTRLLAAFGDPVFPTNYAEFRNSASGELLASAKTSIEPWQRAWRDIELSADRPDLSTIQPLTYSKFELQKLSELGGPSSVVARGFEASRDTLTKLNLAQFSILHFATHALLDPKNPESTGLFLSMLDVTGQPQNGFITTPDVYSLHAPVDLAVLSACSTGLGKDARGEGLIGLTSGFMYAGASSVAASLWKVDDQATADLMEYFYANMLEKGMRPAEALRLAQNTLRKDPRWQSPHYWAGFTFQGDFRHTLRIPTPTTAPPQVQNAVGLALLLMLMWGIGWGFWRRRGPRSATNS
jgi:CHAT domain-containing protein